MKNIRHIVGIMLVFITSMSFAQKNNVNNSKLSDMTSHTISQTHKQGLLFELPKLAYAYNALEPYIDAQTMEIHYQRHHGAYTSNLNNAIAGTDLENKTIEEILASISKHSPAIRNNGGGYYNHNLFWALLSPKGSEKPSQDLAIAQAIEKDFGSFDEFKKQFSQAATTRFGSGWAWLSVDSQGKLFVSSTPNQDNPLMDIAEQKGTPVLGLDVWEHAYYLHYQNKRIDYIAAFFNIINWEYVNALYIAARK